MTDDQSGSESVHVIVELQGVPPPKPGETLNIQGLETEAPELHLPDGTILVGEFEEILGINMVFSDDPLADEVKLRCHTDKKIKFKKKI